MTTLPSDFNDTNTSSVEASDLGWPVGKAPREFAHAGTNWTFVRTSRDKDNDVRSWHYRNADNTRFLTVFND